MVEDDSHHVAAGADPPDRAVGRLVPEELRAGEVLLHLPDQEGVALRRELQAKPLASAGNKVGLLGRGMAYLRHPRIVPEGDRIKLGRLAGLAAVRKERNSINLLLRFAAVRYPKVMPQPNKRFIQLITPAHPVYAVFHRSKTNEPVASDIFVEPCPVLALVEDDSGQEVIGLIIDGRGFDAPGGTNFLGYANSLEHAMKPYWK